MPSFTFRNLGLKLLSVCVASLLWLVVAGERVVERVIRVPVEFQNLPADLEIVGDPPDMVEVRVRGGSGTLNRLDSGDLSLVLDLMTARTGRRLYHLTPGQVKAPYAVEVIQVSPSSVTIEFETTGVRVVRVHPAIDGTPAEGFEVVSVESVPATVEVAGPESALLALGEAITEPVSIAGQSRTVREIVTVGVADSSIRVRAPQTATVTVTIAPVKR